MRPKLKMATGVVRGRGHERSGAPCQDATKVVRFPDRRSVAAVLADGAGSCARSGEGAALVTSTLPEMLHEGFDAYYADPDAAGRTVVEKLAGSIEALARSEGARPGDYACTLLFAYMRWDPRGVRFLAGHLGDGVSVLHDGREVRALSHPDRGEFANTTVFLTSRSATARIRVQTGRSGPNSGFLLMSDGSAESLYSRSRQVPAPACTTLFRILDRLPQRMAGKAFASSLERVLRSRTTDDCSLAMVKAVGMRKR